MNTPMSKEDTLRLMLMRIREWNTNISGVEWFDIGDYSVRLDNSDRLMPQGMREAALEHG